MAASKYIILRKLCISVDYFPVLLVGWIAKMIKSTVK